ncbi:MAG: hypothetical protein QF535_06900 [Anaerolineales bacterium]|nr:hypothetical protein [Anaerolineales bacterium]
MPLTTIGTAAIDDDAITAAKIAPNTVVAADIAADAITASELADDAVDTNAIANLAVTTAKIAADAIDGTKLADNAVNSEHYTDGSIDTVHIAADQITSALIADDQINSEHYVDGSIDTAHIADNQVTLAKMAGLARGKIIIGDASGDPSALTVGTADQVLTSDGTDAAWTDAAGGITWQAVVTGATIMVAGRGYFVNTTSSAFSMTLPTSASLGDEVHIIDYAGTFDTNNCTVARNSHKIQGAASDLVVATERAAFKLVYVDATQGWLLTEL